MKRNSFATMAAAVACVGMVLPPTALAAQPATSHSTDIALRTGGVLVGQVVNQQGVAQAGAPVSIRFAEHEVVSTTTDENGVFAAQGLRGGQYQLLTQDGTSLCRLWAADTAPPAARPAALIVSGDSAVRGQWAGPGTGLGARWLDWVRSHPYITAGIVATAIAVPLALIDDDDDGGPAS